MIAVFLLAALTHGDGSIYRSHDPSTECDRGNTVALVGSMDGGTMTIAKPWHSVAINTDAPVKLAGTPAAALTDTDAGTPELVVVLQGGTLYMPPQDGLYLNVPAAEHAANDRLAVQSQSWLSVAIPGAVGAVAGAIVSGIVTYFATRSHK